MKKGKVFGKRQIVLAALVMCLAAAVWLNMKYSSFDAPTDGNSSTNLGDNQYYDDSNLGEAVQTSTGVNYIVNARKERNDSRNASVENFTKIADSSSADDAAKKEALDGLAKIADCISKESAMETIIKAKGFVDALAIVSDESVVIIVPVESLLTSETLQIQDAVTSQMAIDLEKIQIITVK